MEYRRLGRSGLLVSDISLGTMTFGNQVGEADSHRMMDAAFDGGVTLFDSAEMYAAPPAPETQGESERILGTWLKAKPRDKVVIATKVSGPNGGAMGGIIPHIRGGANALDRHNIQAAAEESLKRLGVDYIDLYQSHWPDRVVPMEEQLEAFDRLIEQGKIRYAGVSNETPWGLTRLTALAEATGLPRMVSVQNVYHLLKRVHEEGMAEVLKQERIGMIAYSPIAMGVLTGKYSSGVMPKGARMSIFPDRFRNRYLAPMVVKAADAYVTIAQAAGLDPAVMAMAWVRTRPTVTTALAGVTKPGHVEAMLKAAETTLPEDVLTKIEEVHREIRNPVV